MTRKPVSAAFSLQDYTADTIKVKYDDIIPFKGMPGDYMAWVGEAEECADCRRKLAVYDFLIDRMAVQRSTGSFFPLCPGRRAGCLDGTAQPLCDGNGKRGQTGLTTPSPPG